MKKTAIIIILSAILLLSISIFLFLPEKPAIEKKEILFIHDLSDEITDTIERQLIHYGNINRDVVIEFDSIGNRSAEEIYSGTEPAPQIFTWKGPFSPPDGKEFSEPVLWIGDKWFLAVNIDLVPSNALEKMSDGITIDEFQEILIDLKEEGYAPLALGNSHRWPLAIWEQHLEVALSNDSDEGVPDLNDDFTESRERSWDKLREWREEGFFLDKVWNEGWAAGIRSVSDDKAAMALMADRMRGSIPPDKRDKFLFLPFPGSASNDLWSIGSGHSLILRTDADPYAESLQLLHYLTSEAVVEILTKESGSSFHGSVADRKTRFIPAWDSLANTQEMREYGEALNQFVSP